MSHTTTEQIEEALPYIAAAPKDNGVLRLIVVRPEENARKILDSCELSLAGGALSDNWVHGSWMSLPDGSPDPDIQVAVTNYRVSESIADSDDKRALAGDQLHVDFDLSEDNLSCGDRLQIGEVVVEVTGVPHNGCKKYRDRFGMDAIKFVNSPLGKQYHMRGIYVRVVTDGTVKVGDRIAKLPIPA